jgi:FdhD protein
MERSLLVEQRVVEVAVQRMNGAAGSQDRDLLAVEEPLEIRLRYGTAEERRSRSITVTMRTPGSDIELAAGFLFAEGLVQCSGDIEIIQHCGPPAGPLQLQNVVRVELQPEIDVDATRLERNFLATSSCGICGKASLGRA